MARGRPVKSAIRQHIVDILYYTGSGYGYDIYCIYREVYPLVTMRSIYYHLKKGVETGEFKVAKIQKEQGEYSWGGEAEKTYYSLGKNAAAHGDFRLRLFLDKRKVKRERALPTQEAKRRKKGQYRQKQAKNNKFKYHIIKKY